MMKRAAAAGARGAQWVRERGFDADPAERGAIL